MKLAIATTILVNVCLGIFGKQLACGIDFIIHVSSRIMMNGSSATAKRMDSWRLKMFKKAINQHIVFMASSSSYSISL